ncbi:MAG: response regulator [bacterium]|nr:response regulator [bacterium]
MQSILIVDDRPENLLALEKILERPGLKIIKAHSGNEALGLLLDHDFALVLLDVMMPEMDGYETAELMRGNSETKQIPIIFVTAINKEKKHVFKGYESGAVDYMFKPLNPDILLSKVNIFLELHKQKTELRKMNLELKKARLEAEIANHAKSQFLNNLSHELRTPMNGVIGMTGLLLDTELSLQQQEFVETVRSSADRLLTVINDILDFSKIDIGSLDLEYLDFNLRRAIEDTSDLITLRADEKKLQFKCLIEPDVPSLVKGDPGRLRQIISYLTENAIKFTSKGDVTLKVNLDEEDGKKAVILFTVTDSGIGIPKNRQKNLFDAFTQLDGSIVRKYGGTGLGLTISKQLVEMMGGKIGVSSRVGRGSTFWFTTTLEKQPDSPDTAGEPESDISGLRVLVVDDNSINRRLLSLLLDSWDCRYEEAEDGISALAHLNEAAAKGDSYDIALLDMQMPAMDGETLGELIKQKPALKNTRLIMMTSTGRRGDAGRLEKIGFDAYMPKPVKQSLLYDCLVTVHGGKQLDVTATSRNRRIVTRHSILEARQRKIRILLVEDNMTNQKTILRTLDKLGCRVDAVANGKEAVKALESIPYDLVLMDTNMPVMNGFDAAKEIRLLEQQQRQVHSRKSRERGVPIIAMTASPEKPEKYTTSGMDAAIPKPVDPRNLVDIIAQWLSEPQGAQPQEAVIFDKEGLMDRVMEDEDLVNELIDEFLKEIPERISDLKKAVDNNNAKEIKHQGHTIKGTSGNMGAIALQKVAARLEAAGQSDDMETAASLVTQLDEQFETFRKVTEKERS